MFFLPALRYTNRTLNLRLSQLPPVPLDGLNLVAGQSVQPPDHGVRQICLRNIPCSPKELPISKKFEMHQLKVATQNVLNFKTATKPKCISPGRDVATHIDSYKECLNNSRTQRKSFFSCIKSWQC